MKILGTDAKIIALKEEIQKSQSPLDVLNNVFQNRTALVVSGGPSAKKWKDIYDMEVDNNPVVTCVKEAINLVNEKCDIHFLNTANLIKYETHHNALTVMTHNSPSQPVFQKYDVNLHIMDKLSGNSNHFLATKQNFECFTLENTGVYRPLGPGIMHESVIYTLVHMGFKRIVTVGWDIADNTGCNAHFNDKNDFFLRNQGVNSFQDSFVQKLKMRLQNNHCLKKIIFKFVRYVPYSFGKKINPAVMFEGEAELVSSSITPLKEWLNSKGVTLIIHSDSKWMKKS